MSTNYVPLFDKAGTQPGNNHSLGQGKQGRGGAGTHWGAGTVSHVKLVSNANDEDLQTGRTKPPIVSTQQPQSIDIVISSNDRASPESQLNPFDFRFSFNSNIFRAKSIHAHKVVIPKPPNLTIQNNSFRIIDSNDLVWTIIIPPGFYTPLTFADTLTTLIDTTTPLLDFAVEFHPLTQTFSITSTSIFFLSNQTSFYQNGQNFVRFPSYNELQTTVGVVGALTFNSGAAGMLYTRYMYVCSESMNENAFAISQTSDASFNEDVIAIVDLTSIYVSSDWDGSVPFSSLFRAVPITRAPRISVRNPQRNLKAEGDIYCLDEFGKDFACVYDLGVGFSENTMGLSVWLELLF
jgi:hypothetical protein